MKSILKNAAPGLYISLASAALALAAMVAYGIMSLDGERTPGIVYALTAAAIVMQLLLVVVNNTSVGRKFYNASSLVAAVLSAFALEQFLMGRVEWLGGLAAHNANFAPLHPSFFVAIVLYALAILASVVAAFCRQVKD